MMKSMKKLRKLALAMALLTLTGCNNTSSPSQPPDDSESSLPNDIIITDIKPTPMVRKDGTQETIATFINRGPEIEAWAKVKVGTMGQLIVALGNAGSGYRKTIMLPVPDTHDMLNPGETAVLSIEFYDNAECDGGPLGSYTEPNWERTRHWEFYLSNQMHTDLGYTAYQESLREHYSGYLDSAVAFIEESETREEDLEKYKYLIESAYQLGEAYMLRRDADQVQAIVDLIKNGSIGIGAARFNHTMETFSAEETARAAYYTNRYLVDKLGIEPATTFRMYDNPAISKSFVDAAVSAGIKYAHHAMNPIRSPYYEKRQWYLYYMEGMSKENKLLVFNGECYGNVWGLSTGVEEARTGLLGLIDQLTALTGEREYIYDKFPIPAVYYGDNKPPANDHIAVANGLNEYWSGLGYVYPRVISAFSDQFFEDVEREYGQYIPVETGTEENWWNDGWGTTAYESGTNKTAGSLIPVAETGASLASILTGSAYPYEDIYNAVEKNLTYDEHTWGWYGYDNSASYINIFEWKRTNAFAAMELGRKVLDSSLRELSSRVNTGGAAIYVHNPLNWQRNDVVTLDDLSGLPDYFEIRDGGATVPYSIADGTLTFVVEGVPALGYKTFEIVETAVAPTFEVPPGIKTGSDFIENEFYKVTFANDGTISSIIDKQNGSREMVDASSPERFNQYNYYDDHGIPHGNDQSTPFEPGMWTLYVPTDEQGGTIDIRSNGISATATVSTSAFRASAITQKVVLYSNMPRIDIVNEVTKDPMPSLAQKEEAYYTFPFKSDNYEIRYDLPIGNTAEGEQVYGTSHDWYTASKWVSVIDKDEGYNMSLAIPNTALLQFGERRTGNWSFDYVSEKPYIFSYVMNNMWWVNFQGDQPGLVDFKYAISTNTDPGVGETSRFGWEVSTPLQATVIVGEQQGGGELAGSYITVDKSNVHLSTMKIAEANSDGLILRFAEITGEAAQSVTVTLPFPITSVTATDVIENDLPGGAVASTGNTFTFSIPAYGIRTFRVRFGAAPAKVLNVQAVSTAKVVSPYENLAIGAKAEASSVYGGGHTPDNAKEIKDGTEWIALGETTPWFKYTWDAPVTIKSILISGRHNAFDIIASATITFSDGTKIENITGISHDGGFYQLDLDEPISTTSIKIDMVGAAGSSNIGLLGFEAYSETYVADHDAQKPIQGTLITWDEVPGTLHYEVFRSTDPNFAPGFGNYLASTKDASWFDAQVTVDMKSAYYYRVRAVAAGAKGAASDAAAQAEGAIVDVTPPEAPILGAQARLKTRIDLYWTPAKDDIMLDRYEVYRDGILIHSTIDNYVISYRDTTVTPGAEHRYLVVAVDTSGNRSQSNVVVAKGTPQ